MRGYGVRTMKRSLSLMGLAVSAGLVVAFVVSLRWDFGYWGHPVVNHKWAPCSLVASRGAIVVFVAPCFPPGASGTSFFGRESVRGFWQGWPWLPWLEDRGSARFLVVPMWVPLVLIVVPSLIAWRSTRRRPGHCRKCQYDLTGNVSGVCPECGAEIEGELRA